MNANPQQKSDMSVSEGENMTLKTRTDGIEQLQNVLKALEAVDTVQYVEENGSNGELEAIVNLNGDADAMTMHAYNNTLRQLDASEEVKTTRTQNTASPTDDPKTVIVAEVTYLLTSKDDKLFDKSP